MANYLHSIPADDKGKDPEIEGIPEIENQELTMHDDKKRRRDGLGLETQSKNMDLDSSQTTQDKTDSDHFLTAGLDHQARRDR